MAAGAAEEAAGARSRSSPYDPNPQSEHLSPKPPRPPEPPLRNPKPPNASPAPPAPPTKHPAERLPCPTESAHREPGAEPPRKHWQRSPRTPPRSFPAPPRAHTGSQGAEPPLKLRQRSPRTSTSDSLNTRLRTEHRPAAPLHTGSAERETGRQLPATPRDAPGRPLRAPSPEEEHGAPYAPAPPRRRNTAAPTPHHPGGEHGRPTPHHPG